MAVAPELIVGLIAVVVVGAGLVSIAGALKRTAARKSYANDSDGGPIYGDGHHHHDDGGDGGGGDGGGD